MAQSPKHYLIDTLDLFDARHTKAAGGKFPRASRSPLRLALPTALAALFEFVLDHFKNIYHT
jgi:hypothetical protein